MILTVTGAVLRMAVEAEAELMLREDVEVDKVR
jgi:hypothetical protein